MEEIIRRLDQHGWCVMPDFLSAKNSMALKHECEELWENGEFRKAGVGRGENLRIREDIRRDEVMWLEPGQESREQKAYLAHMEELRAAINQRFYLGLFTYEGHFAIYQPGAFYKAHLDRHTGTKDRLVTAILYLNEGWLPGDGGELKLWTTPGLQDGPYEMIEPRMGTLVCFFSGDYWHEVMPANRLRMSITGWLRCRGESL